MSSQRAFYICRSSTADRSQLATGALIAITALLTSCQPAVIPDNSISDNSVIPNDSTVEQTANSATTQPATSTENTTTLTTASQPAQNTALADKQYDYSEIDASDAYAQTDLTIDNGGEPVSGIANALSDFSYLEANATYQNQTFSEALYAAANTDRDTYCASVPGNCGDVRYLFQDLLLVIFVDELGSKTTSILPHTHVSRSEALIYARMLDTYNDIDFSTSETFDNNEGDLDGSWRISENFFQANQSAETYQSGWMKMASLVSNKGENISKITFQLVVI
ncbi:MAG: hypothetical protein AAFQ63_12585 [Cyanobacteria bacterium J06621_11]